MDARFQNSLAEGDFNNGLILRQSLTEGDFWTLSSGCYLMYRGPDHAHHIDYDRITACSEEQGLFELPGNIIHEPGKRYFYSVRRVGKSGKGEWGTTAVFQTTFSQQGGLEPNRPNGVRCLNARQQTNGCIYLSWWYWPIGQQSACGRFLIFSDQGTGAIDYENPLGEITYTGRYFYTYLSDPVIKDKTYRFSVRSVDSQGIDDGSQSYVLIQVRPASCEGINNVRHHTSL